MQDHFQSSDIELELVDALWKELSVSTLAMKLTGAELPFLDLR